ncbi:MAG: tryptophan 7-halogenase [Iphinoe sp. HA4291-MV1]|jgi:FADH2 O2-dependent halogenase|nr:tryptophan 7-halogenase [Iphinoe sp. HA4291-MV1]
MFDVVILGSGMAGSILGTILARNNARVLIIDASKHPRFAIGESTVRETTKMLSILADRFDIPEFKYISGFGGVMHKVTPNCGLKRNFGFVYHREGEQQRPNEFYQAVIPDAFEGPEAHYFRQDIDSYLVNVAINYGATVIESTRIANIDFTEKGVYLESAQGARFEAEFVVDATGYRSVLANKFDLRETPSRFKTYSRSIFTHMIGVKPYEECGTPGMHNVPRKWSQGTLHHCFDRGWLWVIPFNNGPDPQNPIVSVGLQLDCRKSPNQNIPPAEEFKNFLSRYPSIAEQFENATPVRDWVSTGDRVQYSSKRTIGYRYCLTAHATGALGPLYSRGLALTMSTILALAEELLEAIKECDFSEQRLEWIDQFQQLSLNNIDSLVAGSYIAWQSFDLWNAWVRVWFISVTLGYLNLQAVHTKYCLTKDPKTLKKIYLPYLGSFCPSIKAYQEFFTSAVKTIDAVDAGELATSDAAAQLFKLIEEADFVPPVFKLKDPETRHCGNYDYDHWLDLVKWGNFYSPKEVKEKLFPGSPDENLANFQKHYEEYVKNPCLENIKQFLENTISMQVV